MEEIELELRKQAEILGNLNLQLNKFVEENQQISIDIVKMEDRILKKKKFIDQEQKDKAIIQEKLIKAEEKKNRLQIQIGDQKIQVKQQQKTPQPQIKRPEFLNKPLKKEEKEKQIKKEENNENSYENGQKGDYQPPLLFNNNEGSDSDEEDDQAILQNVRKTLGNLGNNESDDQEEEGK